VKKVIDDKFEYKMVYPEYDDLDKTLNILGAEGWEVIELLVADSPVTNVFLKRRYRLVDDRLHCEE